MRILRKYSATAFCFISRGVIEPTRYIYRRTDRQGDFYTPPSNFVCEGINIHVLQVMTELVTLIHST